MKIKDIQKKYLPLWVAVPLVSILLVNCVVYWGADALTAAKFHYDFTSDLDRAVPLIPQFIWVYLLAFPFWAVNYILVAQRGKETFYRFVATDLTIHLICFIVFLLIPTTNIRPEVPGNTISQVMLKLMYAWDGGTNPSNLLPSIHCYVSWLSWRGIRGAKEIPVWYQRFSLVFAILIILSTQTLKQHYLIDAIAAIALVELAWDFYKKEGRSFPLRLRHFFEKITTRNQR